MEKEESHTKELEAWLKQLREGDTTEAHNARRQVIEHACRRLEILAARMLKKYPRLRRWEQTGDVMQNALIRLNRSLETLEPRSAAEFYGLAATQIRRELIDLVRHHFGPEGHAAKHQTDGALEIESPQAAGLENYAGPGEEPSTLAEWTEFHESAERLPQAERDVFNLLWYEGLTQVEAAELLHVTERTVKSRWRNAKLLLSDLLHREPPP